MASKNTSHKRTHLQPVTTNPYDVAMQKLGLDWPTIDLIAEEYTNTGDDEHLVLTIVLLYRLNKIASMKANGPESLENYIPLLIDRLYRATEHCESVAESFAREEDHTLTIKRQPKPVERKAS